MSIMVPSKLQEEILHPSVNSTSQDEEPILDAMSDSSPDVQSYLYSDIDPVDDDDGQSTSDSDSVSDDDYVQKYREKWGITLPTVTISAFSETGHAEASIKVPKQRSYTGQGPVIPSSLADTRCAVLGVLGVLDRLNVTLGTSHALDTPSLLSILKECIQKNYDFGTVYGRLRAVWNADRDNMQDELYRCEKEDREVRQRALVGNVIVDPRLGPRRVWDLYSNRVVPYWIADSFPEPISHAWVDEKDRVNVLTPINGKEWPVPIPKDTSLNLIRIEMLNLGKEYVWLDVLCLRQKGGAREDLRAEEWKLDVPTIGCTYRHSQVVIYLDGLGRQLSLREGDLDSDRCWFRRAWTVQEVGSKRRIIAGDTPDGPMHAEPIDDYGNYETDVLTRFHKQLKSLHTTMDIFSVLTAMRDRVSTNPVDRVAGLALSMFPRAIPAYYESRSLEDAWTALVNTMHSCYRALLLFVYPGVGLGCKKWRPTWDQVMMEPLPMYVGAFSHINRDDETDEDSVDGFCIEKGLLRGLDAAPEEGVHRWGELIVKDVAGTAHTFNICVTHQFPIPEDMYTLLCGLPLEPYPGKPTEPKHWAVGRQMPGQNFQKVSVFVMDDLKEVERLDDLEGVTVKCHNVLL